MPSLPKKPEDKPVHTRKVSRIKLQFDRFSSATTKVTGRPIAFLLAVFIVLAWGISGPLFNYSETWQLVINTGTTIITFLMVFIIQQSQNKDTIALQLKLNELIAANNAASNRLINIEDLTEDELIAVKEFYIKLADLAEEDRQIFTTHSVDEAKKLHSAKRSARGLDSSEKTVEELIRVKNQKAQSEQDLEDKPRRKIPGE